MRLMEILTPRRVEDLKVGATTHNTSIITFTLPEELKRVSQEMIFDVRLEDEYERDKWKKIELPRLHVEEARGFLALDSLEFANSDYKVRLRMKARIAMETDDTYSSLAEVSFTTKPFPPVKVPETCRNCFNVMDNGDVVIYWSAVERKLQNAANFFYRVQGNDENGKEIILSDLTETSVVLPRNLSAQNVRIEIRAVNEMGISRNFSQLILPLKNLQANKLLNIHKQLIDYEYRISWKLPKDVDVESFTVVSCRQHNELSNQCDGPIAVNHLKPESSEYAEAANFTKQFGVAVNIRGDLDAQGFEWASCTAAKQSGNNQTFLLFSLSKLYF